MTVQLEQRAVVISAGYLDAGYVDHAYAMTDVAVPLERVRFDLADTAMATPIRASDHTVRPPGPLNACDSGRHASCSCPDPKGSPRARGVP